MTRTIEGICSQRDVAFSSQTLGENGLEGNFGYVGNHKTVDDNPDT